MDEIKDISTQDIQDKWLQGMVVECDTRDLVYHAKQKTTKLFGTHTFLEIPELNAIVAASTVPGVQLYLNPNEDPWEMQEFQACARSPRDFAEMVIHLENKTSFIVWQFPESWKAIRICLKCKLFAWK
jgi:hypothetical protein